MNSICQPQRKMQVLVSNLRFPQHLCQTLLCLTAFTDPSGLTMSKRLYLFNNYSSSPNGL